MQARALASPPYRASLSSVRGRGSINGQMMLIGDSFNIQVAWYVTASPTVYFGFLLREYTMQGCSLNGKVNLLLSMHLDNFKTK